MDEQLPAPQNIQLPSASNLLKQAFSFYISHWQLILGISLIPFFFSLPGVLTKDMNLGVYAILVIILGVIGFLSRLALFSAIVNPAEGVEASYRNGWRMLMAFGWISLSVMLSVIGGLILFVIPGLIISLLLSQSYYILFEEKVKGISALSRSWFYAKGRLGGILWRDFVFGIFAMLVSLPFGLISGVAIFKSALATGKPQVPLSSEIISLILNNFLFIPLGVVYSYFLYKSLKETKNEAFSESEEQRLKKKITIFIIIGASAIAVFMILSALLSLSVFGWIHLSFLNFLSPNK